MEVGNFVGGATDVTLRGLGLDGIKVRSEGCQGVKPNVRPASSTPKAATCSSGARSSRSTRGLSSRPS